jgi:hypothetical protein
MDASLYTDQLSSALIQEGIDRGEWLKNQRLLEIIQEAAEKEVSAREALSTSLQHIENVRDFASDPRAILGSIQTKHGEIAEHIEVEIRNARDVLNHIKPSATFEGVGRTAPEDYLIGTSQVQSKFINGAGKSLDHVLEHLNHYPGFANEGFYHIPKDQFTMLEKVYKGEDVGELSGRTVRKLQELIKQIEQETGKPFTQVVQPSTSTYDEVQLGRVGKTLDGYEKEFHETSDKEIAGIRKERTEQEASAQHITDASWSQALKYGAVSAAITGATSASMKIYIKIKSGKKLTAFTLSDWKEVGYDFTKGSVKGGISGIGIYGLTKVAGTPAPLAGAIVSTAVGFSSLYYSYKKGDITQSEYADAACTLSVEAGLAAIGSALGQALIPIPALGAIIGAAVTQSALKIAKQIMGTKEEAFIQEMRNKYNTLQSELDAQCKAIIDRISAYYDKLGGLIEAALSPEVNRRLSGSITLCEYVGVPKNKIIHNTSELDDFMLT